MVIKKTHIGVYGIIIKNNKIALVKKARGGYKGKLDLPGGGIEHTESVEEALERELMEEAGVNILNKELYKVMDTNIKWEFDIGKYEDLHHIGIIYKVEVKENNLKQIPDGLDSEGANWYKLNNLNFDNLSPFAKEVVLSFKNIN